MSAPAPPDPDLKAATAALLQTGARFVVIGGFAVIAHDYVRATEDIHLLVPHSDANDNALDIALVALDATGTDGRSFEPGQLAGREHIRLRTRAGLLDLLREGGPPLDFSTVYGAAIPADLGDGRFLVAGLESVVAFKRLADRPHDRNDLLELEARHGPLPIVPVPGLDDGED
jgi:hypothetical protein